MRVCIIPFLILCVIPVGGILGKTLEEKMWDIQSLQKGKETPFEQVEAAAGGLLKEYPAPEDQGKIYYQLTLMYAQSGPVCDATIRNAKIALNLPLDPAKRLQLLVYWGDAIQVANAGASGAELAAARREAATVYFRGLKETVDAKIPRDKPEIPTWPLVNHDGPETDEIRRMNDEIKAKMAASEIARGQIAMIEMRETLANQIVFMYSRKPFATEELEESARKALGDSWLVSELVSKTKIEIEKKLIS